MKTRAKNWILWPYLVSAYWIEEESTILVTDTFCVLTSVTGVLYSFILVCLCTSLDFTIGSRELYESLASPILLHLTFSSSLCLTIHIPRHTNSSITSIVSPPVFISFPMCCVWIVPLFLYYLYWRISLPLWLHFSTFHKFVQLILHSAHNAYINCISDNLH